MLSFDRGFVDYWSRQYVEDDKRIGGKEQELFTRVGPQVAKRGCYQKAGGHFSSHSRQVNHRLTLASARACFIETSAKSARLFIGNSYRRSAQSRAASTANRSACSSTSQPRSARFSVAIVSIVRT